MKTSRSKVVATSFLYLTVHKRLAGDVPIYLKFTFKVTHLFRKHWFRPISLYSASAVRVSKKSLIITDRKSKMRFPSCHRWTLCVTPKSPKGWFKTRIFTFCVAFHIYVAGNRIDTSNLVCRLIIASPSLRTTNCPWNGRGHITWSTLNCKALSVGIPQELLKLQSSNFLHS